MKPFSDVKAEDLMQTEVVTLQSNAPIREALETFEDLNIKGAPVLDSAGNLVGVLTASDVAKSVHLSGDRLGEQRGDYYLTDPLDDLGADGSRRSEEFFGKEDYSTEVLGEEVVGDWMTPKVISVAPSTTLTQICKTMTEESIHRVLVVNNGRILGIVSTFDIVRHLATHAS